MISAVAFAARNKFFPAGNKIAKTAEQRLAAGGRPARLVAYQVTAGDTKTTMVIADSRLMPRPGVSGTWMRPSPPISNFSRVRFQRRGDWLVEYSAGSSSQVPGP